jgi:diacylglycerol kinase family enzyme
MDHWTIVFNPTSGTYRPATLDRIQRTLRDAGIRSVALGTDYAGHATDLVRNLSGTDCVACYSGDGTLNEVAGGLLGRNLPLAFLPGGTANVMAHELGLPRDAVKAVQALLRGKPRPIRPGTVGPGVFLLMAGIGFDARAVGLVTPRLKTWLGRGAYVWAGLRALLHEDQDLRVTGAMDSANAADAHAPVAAADPNAGAEPDFATTSNGAPKSSASASSNGSASPLSARWLVVARAGKYAGPFVVHPQAALESSELGVAAVGAGSVVPFLVGNLGMGTHESRAGRRLLRATRLVVEADGPVPLQVDGDSWGQARRIEIGIAEDSIQMCFPGT